MTLDKLLTEQGVTEKSTEVSDYVLVNKMLSVMEDKYSASGNNELMWYARTVSALVRKSISEAHKPEDEQSLGNLTIDGLIDPHIVFENVQKQLAQPTAE